jgi:hypothetical protein
MCKEYYGLPKWFTRQFHGTGNGAPLNIRGSRYYVGRGFDPKRKTWTDGSFITDFEAGLPFWQKEMAEADFIVHFEEAL